MPSFLNDENAPIDTSRPIDILLLDKSGIIFRKPNLKHASKTATGSTAYTTVGNSNDGYDESSTSTEDSHISDNSEGAAHADGSESSVGHEDRCVPDASMNSVMPNGVINRSQKEAGTSAPVNGDNAAKPKHVPAALDLSSSKQPAKDENPRPQTVLPDRTSSLRDVAPQTAHQLLSPGSQEKAGLAINLQTSTPSDAPSTPDREIPSRRTNSPHRFSSPPHFYPPGSAPASSSTSAGLHPPGAALKHRHTLEVPRLAPPRTSKDGSDSAFASGRFSPTSAGTPVVGRRASLSLVRRNTRSVHSDMPRDDAIQDEDALRWAEAYRQKRASKRRRREEEDDDRVLVGTKVDEKHANWVVAYNMLTGIRVSVSRTNAKVDRPLTGADFEAKQKSTFDITGNELIPSAKYDFKFKDYAPWVFRHLRALFRLDPADYLVSLTGKYILSELGSPGKSGSFFYFSRDYRFIIKTIHHAEHKFLRKVLKEYYQHVTDNPNTLLSQFYGLHRVKTPWGRKIHFVVMNNLFPPHRDIHATYDLKGSTEGREYHEDSAHPNPRATLKDMNWLRRKQHLELGLEKKQLFMDQLHSDVELMQKLHIMDYSLLIGIHDLERGNEEGLRARNLAVFSLGGEAAATSEEPDQILLRTRSRQESQRRASALRHMIRYERPTPMGTIADGMPEVLKEGARSDSIFYQDDGGMMATHEDNAPGEEVYYLGVIDCLTHYGVVKKMEHFIKGIMHDSTAISAVPPEQYGNRFLAFMEGITMSPEEAAERRQNGKQAAVDAQTNPGRQRASSASVRPSTSQGRLTGLFIHHTPKEPMTMPSPTGRASGSMSPAAEEAMRKAEYAVARSERHGASESNVPERTLVMVPHDMLPLPAVSHTSPLPASGEPASHSSHPVFSHHRGSVASETSIAQPQILPVVEEAAEVSSTGGRSASHVSNLSQKPMADDDDHRPLTPAKDYVTASTATNGGTTSPTKRAWKQELPPSPPKSAVGNGTFVGSDIPAKSNSTNRGTDHNTTSTPVVTDGHGGRSRSGSQASKASLTVPIMTGGGSRRVRSQISRDSLDKDLPPLPAVDVGK